jgi:hypothetical protein
MKTTKLVLAALGTLALAAPVMADDTTTTGTTPTAQQQCRTEQTQMGKATFAQTYGTNKNKSNAFGKCVSKRSTATQQDADQAHTNAAQSCKTEETADPAAFQAKYGTGKNGKNAYGKCVSQSAKAQENQAVADQTSADVSAAKSCKAERKADPAAFKAKYGTNHNKSNAFGKCVSQQAKAQQDQQGQDQAPQTS